MPQFSSRFYDRFWNFIVTSYGKRYWVLSLVVDCLVSYPGLITVAAALVWQISRNDA
jgi:hypothetical protein